VCLLHHVVTASGECVRFVYLRLGLRPRVALYVRSTIALRSACWSSTASDLDFSRLKS